MSAIFYFNSRDPYGPRFCWSRTDFFVDIISIHATHTGRDFVSNDFVAISYISIHATHTGRDSFRSIRHGAVQFQFTRPIRAAIFAAWATNASTLISIHATHTGRDIVCMILQLHEPDFNSRDPYGPRFSDVITIFPFCTISIHATHTGRDHKNSPGDIPPENFNSRDPYGPRSISVIRGIVSFLFQFTRPIRAAMRSPYLRRAVHPISIHATHTGRDLRLLLHYPNRNDFNSRDPYGPRSQSSTNYCDKSITVLIYPV